MVPTLMTPKLLRFLSFRAAGYNYFVLVLATMLAIGTSKLIKSRLSLPTCFKLQRYRKSVEKNCKCIVVVALVGAAEGSISSAQTLLFSSAKCGAEVFMSELL